MKKLLVLSLALISQQGLACVQVSNAYICAGDTVFKGLTYSQGATVVAENPYTQQVTVRSNVSGNLALENIYDLDITQGCLGEVCVGEKIFKGSSYSQGANVIGINYSRQTLTVRSLVSGNLSVENLNDLEVTRGCIENLCVGDRVFKGTSYSQGADVQAINHYKRTVTVRSVVSGNIAVEILSDLFLPKGCLGSVCVNDRVFKGTSYSQGATVVAINNFTYMVLVRSVISGNLAVESIYDLQNGSNQPQWPTPIPTPTPPAPRPPRPNPVPAPGFEMCTVNRLDPSGMFITSYVQSGYTRSDACRAATSDCSRDLKGRQTCNIVR